MEITKEEVTRCKRAVLALKDLSDVALNVARKDQLLEMKVDILTLVRVLKRLDGVAK